MKPISITRYLILLVLGLIYSNKIDAQQKPSLNPDDAEELIISNKNLQQSFEASVRAWDRLKNEHNNSYEYTIIDSTFSGYKSKLVTTVTTGRVTRREFWETKKTSGGGFGPMEIDYIEAGRTIARNKKGGRPMTMDRFYINCAQKSLVVNQDKNTINFKTDGNGLLTICGHTPNGCADDCFEGIKISNFKWLE